MNVKLQYDLAFLGGIWFDNCLQLNSYQVNLQLITRSTDQVLINIAMERLKCFVYSELESAVFVAQSRSEPAEMMNVMGINVVTLPSDPVDQIVGMMLYCKLNAVMEDVIRIQRLDISSTLGDNVWYQFDEEEDSLGPFVQDGWWHRPDLTHTCFEDSPVSDNVVKVTPDPWHDYSLSWPDTTPASQGVVYVNFGKHED
jgi:hypothetical protein